MAGKNVEEERRGIGTRGRERKNESDRRKREEGKGYYLCFEQIQETCESSEHVCSDASPNIS